MSALLSRDPFYGAILAALETGAPADLFEHCVVDLISPEWPGIVVVPGGSDSGFDGAVPQGQTAPFPLIATTARPRDLASNLERNLNTYLRGGGSQRVALFATTQEVGGQKRIQLMTAAAALGFELLQIYGRQAIADRLYRHPRWAKNLLGLSGLASALSVQPRSGRAIVGECAIGRDDELAWLRDTRGDKVLVGQPGSGKTFLFWLLARENRGLFVVLNDLNKIADSVRKDKPENVFLDDAHSDLELLIALNQLRREIQADFHIVASTWPSRELDVQDALSLATTSVRRLERLSRDDIVKVVAAAGIRGPNDLVREIVNQAEGRPGLAVTLAHLCRTGDGQAVVNGTALKRSFAPLLRDLSASNAREILAILALGGDPGIAPEDAASALGLSIAEVVRIASELASGGVVAEGHARRISVRPPRLRYAVIRDVFFGSPVVLPLAPALAATSDMQSVALSLVGAKHVGAAIPETLLQDLVTKASSGEVWSAYAWSDRTAALWTLRNAPEDDFFEFVGAGLYHAPDEFLDAFLETTRRRTNQPDTERRFGTIKNWVESTRPGTPEVVERRRALIAAGGRWIQRPGGALMAAEAFRHAMSPAFHDSEMDPGAGKKVTLHFGMLPLNDLRHIAALWRETIGAVGSIQLPQWAPLLSAAEAWAYPSRHGHGVPSEEAREFCESVALEMFRDIARLSGFSPGVVRRAQVVAETLDLDLQLPNTSAAFDVLFPRERFNEHDWRAADDRDRAAVLALADALATESPETTISLLVQCEHAATQAGVSFPRYLPECGDRIAKLTTDHIGWAELAMNAGLAADAVAPFIDAAILTGQPGWDLLSDRCLNSNDYAWPAARALMRAETVPPELLHRAVNTPWKPIWACIACADGLLTSAAVALLLQHPDNAVAGMAAAGLWRSNRVSEENRALAHNALMRCPPDQYQLESVLSADASLACDYVAAQIARQPYRLWEAGRLVAGACGAMSVEQRIATLRRLSGDAYAPELVRNLVGDSVEVFRALLSEPTLKKQHLCVLGDEDSLARWSLFAECALDHGYSAEQISDGWFCSSRSWSGHESNLWLRFSQEFRNIAGSATPRIAKVATLIADRCADSATRALTQEKAEAVYGW